VGGQALTYNTASNKVFMGGGGGAGDGNNNEATSGANGGGIVIIMANTLVGNGKKINANGNAVNILARSDGAGGGGGGGAVLLYVDNYTGNLQVNAVGGDGGLLDNGGSNSFCMGPGGGGGGGALWVKTASVPANINFIDTGGYRGWDNFGFGPPACPYGTTNGSQSGAAGGSITNLTIITDAVPFVKLEATACCPDTVCAGEVVTITVTDTASFTPTIIWSTGENTNTITPQVFATTTYTVNVSDNRGCLVVREVEIVVRNTSPIVTLCCDTGVCLGATVQFTTTVSPAGQYTYNWSTGESSPDITKAIVFPRTFTVTVTDVNGCSVAKSVSATVSNAALPLTVCCDTTVCSGSQVTFTATVGGSGQFSYAWSTGETTPSVTKAILGPQQYTITATDANGCSVSGSAQASVNNIPPPLSVCCDTTVCPGTPVNFLATVAAQGTFTYAWSSGKSTAAVTEIILATRPYTVTVTDVNGCSASASAFATANNNGPQLSVCCDTLVCAGSQVNFSASSTVNVTYVWSTGQTTAAITTPVASSTVIYVTATDANGCVGIQGVNANTVNAYTEITAVPDTAINVGQSVQLAASGSPAFTYTWSPTTDLSSGSVFNPLASPVATTTYCVTVTDNYGCLASDCIDVNVIQKDIVIKVPDAFTPNGNDAANHVFTIFPIADTRVAEVKIYNRWGEVVFSAQGNAAWDGTYQGKAQPAGAYVCRIIYGSAAEPGSKTLTKDFLLIR
jgi:gliding motility-associated-like protein